MSKLECEHDILPSTKSAEGFYNGLKFSLCHALTFGLYMSKEDSLNKGTSFKFEFAKNSCRSIVFFSLLSAAILITFALHQMHTSFIHGQRQLVLVNRDIILARLHSLHPLFQRKRALTDITLYSMMFAPLGIGMNYIASGRVIRGSFSMTLMIALFMRIIEEAQSSSSQALDQSSTFNIE